MSGICAIIWVLFAFALFSSNSWKTLPSQCKPFLHEKGKSAPTRIIAQIPLMESYDLHAAIWKRRALKSGEQLGARISELEEELSMFIALESAIHGIATMPLERQPE